MDAERRGWIMLVRDTPDCKWGGIDDFYEELEESVDSSGIGHIEFNVKGRVAGGRLKLAPGDGVAFYHSKKSRFPLPDPLGGRQRISLIGDLVDVEQQGDDVTWMAVRFRGKVLQSFRRGAILRDESTEFIFTDSGMVRGGSAGTFFETPPKVWAKLEERSTHRQISDEEASQLASEAAQSEAAADQEEAAASGEEEGPVSDTESFEGTANEVLALPISESDALRKKKLAKFREQQSGRLGCEVCGHDFETSFGDLGKNFIHVHHLEALESRLADGKKTRLGDLAALCANCHAMAHQKPGKVLELKELRKLFLQRPHARPR